MPTSSQSKILSVVDYQLLQQQQQQPEQQQQQHKASGQTRTTKSPVRISVSQNLANETKRQYQKEDRRPSIENKYNADDQLSPPSNLLNRRRSADKTTEGKI